MVTNDSVLAMIMAGGKGERLFPLTLERSKPSVPFGGKYRIVDFVLSNFVNSGMYSIYVLVQYKSQSLIEHIRSGWKRQGMLSHHFITVVPPQMRRDNVVDWYRGTADAIYQNMNLIRDFMPDYVAVFGADHIYRMNVKAMLAFHKKHKADLSIACIPTPRHEASDFGIVEVDAHDKIVAFDEKPANPKGIPYNPDFSFASMGNYIFDTKVLLEALERDAADENSRHDFGKDIIPKLIKTQEVYAYDFNKNVLPGLNDGEEEAYWRDVGTIESYYNAHMDLLGEKPKLDLSNLRWPVHSATMQCSSARINGAHIDNAIIGDGCNVKNAKIKNSILGRCVTIEDGVELDGVIAMDYTVIKKGAKIKHAIVDRFNTIEKNARIGHDVDKDKEKYHVSETGVVVIKRGPRQVYNLG
jgi:glucose-1-phosphate adenylyltransferase